MPNSTIPVELIENKIYLIRKQKVMLSMHLAELYGVEPRTLVQAAKRNMERFPEDFMFQLNNDEFDNLKSQIVTSSWGGLRRGNQRSSLTPAEYAPAGMQITAYSRHTSKQKAAAS